MGSPRKRVSGVYTWLLLSGRARRVSPCECYDADIQSLFASQDRMNSYQIHDRGRKIP